MLRYRHGNTNRPTRQVFAQSAFFADELALRPSAEVSRRGNVAVEMLLIVPVFLVLLLGFVEFNTIVVVEERLAAASAQGARVASQGGAASDIQTAVYNSLGAGTIRDNLNPPVLTPSDPTTADSGTPITVRLEVPANLAVPDLLNFIGYSISNQVLVGQTVMRKE